METNLTVQNDVNETISQENLIKSKNQNWEKAQLSKLRQKIDTGTPYNDVINYVMNEYEQSKKMSNFDYKIECFKDDGVYQLHRAITKKLGVAKHRIDSNPSGEERPINTISVTLYTGVTYKVPYGKIQLEDMGKDAYVDIAYGDEDNCLYVRGKCQFRFSSLMDEIIDITRLLLNTDSIYKNLAIELDNSFKPRVMNLSNIHQEFMVLSAITEEGLKPVKARILNAEGCKAKKVPLKYGVLLYGKYGTGKTLLAFKLAAEAIQNNWCFIYLKDPTLLAQTLRLSKTLDKNGNGVIIFVED